MRELRESDAEQVAALFVECFGDARLVDPEEIRSWLRKSELEPGWLRVLEENGGVVGYGDIWPKEQALDLDAATRDRWEPIFDWAEEEAQARGIPVVRIQIPHEHPLAAYAARRGYEPWRFSHHMEISLDAPPARAVFPAGIVVEPFREEQEGQLIDGINAAFADDPFHEDIGASNFQQFFRGARGFTPDLFFLAWDAGELAGFSLCHPQHGSDLELGWVNTLGVLAPWRRQGLGEALLRHSFAELHGRGRRRVGLGVDAQNVTGALRLYERVGMRIVDRNDNWQKTV